MARAQAVLAIAFLIPSLAVQAQIRTVRGEVRDTAGNPLEHVDVIALLEGRIAQTNRDGSFSLDSVTLGEQRFLFRRVGYHRVEITVVIARGTGDILARLAPVALTLDPVVVSAGRTGLFGVVGDTAYGPIGGAEIHVVGGGRTVTDSAGGFTLPKVRGGTYMLRIRKKGYYAERRSITIPRGESLELSVLLNPVRAGLSPRQVAIASGYAPRLEWALGESDSRRIRCAGGSSVLVPREELAEQGRGSLADALPRTRSAASRAYGRMELLQYQVFVDGQVGPRVADALIPVGDAFDENRGQGWPLAGISVEDVEAVEIYKGWPRRARLRPFGSSAPRVGERQGFGSCPQGTIWIWMR